MNKLLFGILLVSVLLLVACPTGIESSSLSGTIWGVDYGTMTTELHFNADGTGKEILRTNSTSIEAGNKPFTWSTSGSIITFVYPDVSPDPFDGTFVITGDQLDLDVGSGEDLTDTYTAM